MGTRSRLLILPIIVGVGPGITFAQGENLNGASAYSDVFGQLTFRSMGPASMDSRIRAFAVRRHHPNTVYVVPATGGVWKSANRGTTWEPIFDRELFPALEQSILRDQTLL
jgi:hypothetical protein